MRLIPWILLACSFPALAQAADQRVKAVLHANQAAVGSMPEAGAAVYRYGYSGDGLTGESTKTVDLGTGAYVERLDTGFLHTAEGFDTRTPWTRDISGANTPEQGGDPARVAVSAAYRNANLWWRQDLAGARIEYVGRDTLAGAVRMHDQVAFATGIYTPDIEGIPVDGMVGFELFRRLIVRIDYGRRILTFTLPGHASFRNAGVAVPFVFYTHLPFVRGRIDEMPATFDVDTGSRSELDVTSPAVARYRLRDRYPRGARAVTGWGVGGPSESYVVRLRSVTLGTVTVSAPVADLSGAARGSFSDPNFDGNIGSGFLKRFVVTFDYGHQVMYLRRIEPAPPDVGDFDRSGLWINATKGGYSVTYVAAHSPAAQAGLHTGDVIVELDGRPARAEDLSDARELLRARPAGTHVPMLVKGKTGSRRLVLTLRDQI